MTGPRLILMSVLGERMHEMRTNLHRFMSESIRNYQSPLVHASRLYQKATHQATAVCQVALISIQCKVSCTRTNIVTGKEEKTHCNCIFCGVSHPSRLHNCISTESCRNSSPAVMTESADFNGRSTNRNWCLFAPTRYTKLEQKRMVHR